MDSALPPPIPQIPMTTPTLEPSAKNSNLVPLTFATGLIAGLAFVGLLNRPLPQRQVILGTNDSSYQNPFEIIEQQRQPESNNPFENLR